MEKETFGVMLDCSRNAVMNRKTFERFVDLLAKLGYNAIMLYTEDTYEIEGEPLFGYMRGRYTKEDLKYFDKYCLDRGIELIPCVQTLAHLNTLFKWRKYEAFRDTDDILLLDDERTYKLIDNMFKTIKECFTTDRVHIGMDEAHRLGAGRYLDTHEYKPRFDMVVEHLNTVSKMAEGYGLKPMMWADMLLKRMLPFFENNDEQGAEALKKHANLDKNITLIDWCYGIVPHDIRTKRFKAGQAFGNKVGFAGSFWCWKGIVPCTQNSVDAAKGAIEACRANGVTDMFFTMWGDDGAEGSKFMVLPAIFAASEYFKGNTDIEDIKVKFKQEFNCDFDDFIRLEDLDTCKEDDKGQYNESPAKYLLYNDPFVGCNEFRIFPENNEYYKNLAKEIRVLDISDEYRYIFDTSAALCDLLAVKNDLGYTARKLYKAGDKKGLKEFAETAYPESIRLTRAYHRALRNQWYKENRTFGFEVQDIRLGGLMLRLENCKEMIIDYCEGKIENIPELEQELTESVTYSTLWNNIVSPAVI